MVVVAPLAVLVTLKCIVPLVPLRFKLAKSIVGSWPLPVRWTVVPVTVTVPAVVVLRVRTLAVSTGVDR